VPAEGPGGLVRSFEYERPDAVGACRAGREPNTTVFHGLVVAGQTARTDSDAAGIQITER